MEKTSSGIDKDNNMNSKFKECQEEYETSSHDKGNTENKLSLWEKKYKPKVEITKKELAIFENKLKIDMKEKLSDKKDLRLKKSKVITIHKLKERRKINTFKNSFLSS